MGGLRSSLDTAINRWLCDHYELYWWLADLQFAVAGISSSNHEALRNKITDFARQYQMPFFKRIEQVISPQATETLYEGKNIEIA